MVAVYDAPERSKVIGTAVKQRKKSVVRRFWPVLLWAIEWRWQADKEEAENYIFALSSFQNSAFDMTGSLFLVAASYKRTQNPA